MLDETLKQILGIVMVFAFTLAAIRYVPEGRYKLIAFLVGISLASILAALPLEPILLPIWVGLGIVSFLVVALACLLFKLIQRLGRR